MRSTYTAAQRAADAAALTADPRRVAEFVESQTHYAPGEILAYGIVYGRFVEWLRPEERLAWTKRRFSRALPKHHPTGLYSANAWSVGNLAFERVSPGPSIIVKHAGRLKRLPIQ